MATYPGRDSASVLKFAGFAAMAFAALMGYGLYEANKAYEAGGDLNEIQLFIMIVLGLQAVLGAAFCFGVASSAENTAALRDEVDKIRAELTRAVETLSRIESQTSVKRPS